MSRHVFSSTDAVAAELIRVMIDDAMRAIVARGKFSVALTGGSAASALYPILAQAPLPWAQVHVWFGDERAVPADSDDSNYKLVRAALLDRTAIAAVNVHRVRAELVPAQAALAYENELLSVHPDGVLDCIHLGLGPDGHVLSLFEHHALLRSSSLVDALLDSPKPPAARVTLTLEAVKRARHAVFLVLGDSKTQAVADAILNVDSTSPAAEVSRVNNNVTWLLDADAGKQLKSQ